jgi:Pregnancy-associated plasma protein-A
MGHTDSDMCQLPHNITFIPQSSTMIHMFSYVMLSFILFMCIVLVLTQDPVSAHRFHDELQDAAHNHFHSHALRSTPVSSSVGEDQTSMHRDMQNTNSGSRCGSKDPPKAWIEESSRIVSKWRSTKRLGLNQVSTIEVPTYFHVITAGTVGAISVAQLQQQIKVLNDSYRPYGFLFTLLNTTRTDNSDWYSSSAFSTQDDAMKTALRLGGVSTLNVYFKDIVGSLGYSTFPEEYNADPKLDSVVVSGTTIPGSDDLQYNQGKTLVHEVGHWLGLYHTFQSGTSILADIPFFSLFFGCFTNGDFIDDTPTQRVSTFGCPIGKDTCFFQSGVDPIHNYMDYSDDSCYSEFTAGQAERMWAMWTEYRAS